MVFVVVVAESKKATFVRRRVDMILKTTKTQRAFCVCLFLYRLCPPLRFRVSKYFF